MISRTLEISGGPAHLSVAHGQLKISRPEKPPMIIPSEDIGLLIVDHPAVTYSHAVLTTLAAAGAAVVVCGRDHLPAALMLPLCGNSLLTERSRYQIEAKAPLRKRLWQALVRAKIAQQGALLRHLGRPDHGLSELARRVRSGDPDNLEGQAAQRYWPALLGPKFRRLRNGAPPNNLLNYGYMALRACVGRALVGSGLLPAVGLHHRHRNNPFVLADDVLEPYRPFVDWKVTQVMAERCALEEIDREAKAAMLSVLNERIAINGATTPVQIAIQQTASSLMRSFQNGQANLALPTGMPLRPEEAAMDG